jgi:histidine ammonia-lyase
MLVLNGNGLDINKFILIAKNKQKVEIAETQKELVNKARKYVDDVVKNDKVVYGITTGFGKLSETRINACDVEKLQENLLKSHACTVGNIMNHDVVRGMMLLRVNALIRGNSGIRLIVLEKLIEMLNKDVIPVVFEQGSLGASGDLAPLSNMSLPLIGLGECFYQGIRMDALEAFKKAQITPLDSLKAKEGLSLINGTQAMTSIGAFLVYDAMRLLDIANVSLSLTMEALNSIIDAYDPRVHEVRGQKGQIEVAKKVNTILKGSGNITKQGQVRVQDAYSIRCAPQVHGASLDAFIHAKNIIEIEMNAVTDNPIIFADENDAISAGNFHGQPLALIFDYMKTAISEMANISERRLERLVNPQLSEGLPPFLAKNPGTNSGYMIVQYSAASLVSDNKVLAHPSSVDSITSSANQEDHVSMGTNGALQAKKILENTQKVIAMEILTACQALDFRGNDKLGKYTSNAYKEIRKYIPFLEEDAVMYPLLHKAEGLIIDGSLYHAVFKEDRL